MVPNSGADLALCGRHHNRSRVPVRFSHASRTIPVCSCWWGGCSFGPHCEHIRARNSLAGGLASQQACWLEDKRWLMLLVWHPAKLSLLVGRGYSSHRSYYFHSRWLPGCRRYIIIARSIQEEQRLTPSPPDSDSAATADPQPWSSCNKPLNTLTGAMSCQRQAQWRLVPQGCSANASSVQVFHDYLPIVDIPRPIWAGNVYRQFMKIKVRGPWTKLKRVFPTKRSATTKTTKLP